MKSHYVLGMRLDCLSPEEGVSAIMSRVQKGQSGYCCVPNVHMCIETVEDESFRNIVNGATWTWSDSTVLQKACALRHGEKSRPIIKGAEMMKILLTAAMTDNISVGLYGASEETIKTLKQNLPQQFPGLKLDYAFSPPFRELNEKENKGIIHDINKAGIRLLFIGLGCPKQERWMAKHTKDLPDTVMIGVGAAFDFNAGTIKPSPGWIHRYGLEWLYRMIKEPRRLARRYLTTNPKFVILLARDLLKSHFKT